MRSRAYDVQLWIATFLRMFWSERFFIDLLIFLIIIWLILITNSLKFRWVLRISMHILLLVELIRHPFVRGSLFLICIFELMYMGRIIWANGTFFIFFNFGFYLKKGYLLGKIWKLGMSLLIISHQGCIIWIVLYEDLVSWIFVLNSM